MRAEPTDVGLTNPTTSNLCKRFGAKRQSIRMPELPDIVVYMEALEQRVVGHVLESLEVRGPSLLRTADPPIYSIQGHRSPRCAHRQTHCFRLR